jgi:hypothetical protein
MGKSFSLLVVETSSGVTQTPMHLVRMVLNGVKRGGRGGVLKLTTALLIAEVKNKWNFIACTGRRVPSAWNFRAS